MSASNARFLLKQDGNEIAAARKRLEELMLATKKDAVQAYKFGVSISDISHLTGLSRQTIYTVLNEAAGLRGRVK